MVTDPGARAAMVRAEHETFLGILRRADALARRLAETLEPFKLTLSQYSVLESLRGAGTTGLTCRQIAEQLLSRDPDITRLLDRLEGRGLVTRHRARPDRRVVRALITADGLALLAAVEGPLALLRARQVASLGEGNLAMLDDLLRAAEASP